MSSRAEARAKNLGAALKSRRGVCTAGNHRVEVKDLRKEPSYPLCEPCPYNMRCCVQGEVVGEPLAATVNAPCLAERNLICFYYHDSLCLTYDRAKQCVTDHCMWGYSATTTQSIGTYLHALSVHGFIPLSCIDNIKKVFKKRDDDGWIDVSEHS